MPFPVFLIVPAVRAALRLKDAGDRALAQYARDRDSYVPGLDVVSLIFVTEAEKIGALFESKEAQASLKKDPQLAALYNQFLARPHDQPLQNQLKAAARSFRDAEGDRGVSPQVADEFQIAATVSQWQEGKGPLRPWERFAISFTDVALEFVGSNPGLLGIGGNGEKIIGAVAVSLLQAIDDEGEFGPRHHFGERVLATVLRAGLQTAASHPDLIFDEEHLQAFVKETTAPIIKAFPAEQDSLRQQTNWHNVVDALLGPAASAAFQVVTDNPKAFLGKTFAPEEALGAVTQALLKSAAETGLAGIGKKESLIALYKAALGVAVSRPELFLGKAESDRDKFINDLFSKTVGVLKTAGPRFDSGLGIEIASVALESLQSNIQLFVHPADADPWNKVLQGVIGQVIGGINTGLQQGGKFDQLLTTDQLTDFARIFFVQVSKTPGMVTGDGGQELEAIVAGVARAMAADHDLLLTGDAWLEIVAVAAEEAAANPGRLFGFDDSSPEGQIAEHLIQNLLTAASDDLGRGRAQGAVLFGDTLKSAVITTLRGVSGNLAGARAALNGDKILKLAQEISKRVRAKGRDGVSFDLGSKEWLAVYRDLLAQVLTKGTVPSLVDDAGKPTADGEKIIQAILAAK